MNHYPNACKEFLAALEYGPVLIYSDGWLMWAYKDGTRIHHKWIGERVKMPVGTRIRIK